MGEELREQLSKMRREYSNRPLNEAEVDADPFRQFELWMADAVHEPSVVEPNAMSLASAAPNAKPTVRMVLCKGVDPSGFVFYTNSLSTKGRQMLSNPHAAGAFYWAPLERQVRITGRIYPISREETQAYFDTRPHGAKLAAWASMQSQVIESRSELEERMEQLRLQYPEGVSVPAPPYWTGYRLSPMEIEFWQGRTDRLHDRLRYRKLAEGRWQIERLAP